MVQKKYLEKATSPNKQKWGGLIRGPFGAFSVFKAAADFATEWHNIQSNVKETFAHYTKYSN